MIAVDLGARQIADDDQRIAKGLERLQDRRELEAGARGRRRPLLHDHAVRDVDEADALLRAAARAHRRCSAGTIASSNGSARAAPAPRRNVRRGMDIFEMNITSDLVTTDASASRLLLASGTARSSQSRGRATRIGSCRRRRHGRSSGRPACRRPRGCGRARRSAASRSSCRPERSGRFEQRLAQLHHAVDLACRRRARPRHRSAMPASSVRHAPTASKFSSARPSGSITLWQLAHAGLARCCSIRARTVFGAPGVSSGNGGTTGGGGGGGVPIRLSRIHLPRTTGDVRSACDVTSRMPPLPSRPLRASSVHRHPAEVADRRRSGCRSAAPAARSRTCSRPSSDRARCDPR